MMADDLKPPTCTEPDCDVEQHLVEFVRNLWCRTHLGPRIEGQARMARARQAAGQRLNDEDRAALARFPKPSSAFVR